MDKSLKTGIISDIKISKEFMIKGLKTKYSKSLIWFKKGKLIHVNNLMQKGYTYKLTYNAGTSIDKGGVDEYGNEIDYKDFKPHYSPSEMIHLGVFEGKYCNDQIFEFPKEWFSDINKLSPDRPDITINFFKIKSRQSLQEWKRKKWIPCHPNDMDTRGWFEWYCRYWCGRRMPEVDSIQIKRWKSFTRHYAQYIKNTKGKGLNIHPKRRQALLQWSWSCME